MVPRRGAWILAVALSPARSPRASAAIPAPPSEWYGLPGLNARRGAQWVRAYRDGTPPNVVYAGLEGGGVFRSTNGGATWSAFNSRVPEPADRQRPRAAGVEHRARPCSPAPTRDLEVDRRRLAAARAGHRGRPGPAEEAQRVGAVARQPHRRQHDARGRLLGRRLQEHRRRRDLDAARAPATACRPARRSTGSPRTCPGWSTRRRAAASTCRPTRARRGRARATASRAALRRSRRGRTRSAPDPLHVDRLERHLPLDQRRADLGADQRRPRRRPRARLPDLHRRAARARTSTRRPRTGCGRRSTRARSRRRRRGGGGHAGRPDRAGREQHDHVVAHRAGHPGRRRARPDRRDAVQRRLLPLFEPPDSVCPSTPTTPRPTARGYRRHHADRGPDAHGAQRQVDGTAVHRLRLPVAALHGRRGTCTDIADAEETTYVVPSRDSTPPLSRRGDGDQPGADVRHRDGAQHDHRRRRRQRGELPGHPTRPPRRTSACSAGRDRPRPTIGDQLYAEYGTTPNRRSTTTAGSTRPATARPSSGCAATAPAADCNEIPGATQPHLHARSAPTGRTT